MKVAILGASDNPERYAFKAFKMLKEYGHTPLPVTPKLTVLDGTPVYSMLDEVPRPVDTLTMYVGPAVSSSMLGQIISLKPRRVIFNPGAENPDLQNKLASAGILVEEACTLVLLKTNQF